MLCLLSAFSYNTILPSSGHTLYLRAYPEENIDMLLQKNRGTLFFSPALRYTSLPCPVILKGLASVRKVMLAPCCLSSSVLSPVPGTVTALVL